jgi:hypothetical protein
MNLSLKIIKSEDIFNNEIKINKDLDKHISHPAKMN